jgi:uncharacterized cupredoxin-like copper-binding protein
MLLAEKRRKDAMGPVTLLRSMLRLGVTVSVLAIAFLMMSCGDDEETTRTIDVSAREYQIDVDRPTLPAGSTVFKVTNQGDEPHELVVLRTEVDADALPTAEDDTVDLEADGIDVVATYDSIEPGAVVSKTLDIDDGSYVIICNLPTHYEQGMRAVVTAE